MLWFGCRHGYGYAHTHISSIFLHTLHTLEKALIQFPMKGHNYKHLITHWVMLKICIGAALSPRYLRYLLPESYTAKVMDLA